jgi:hypothetical protein
MSRLKEAQDKKIAHMSKTIAKNIQQGEKTGNYNKLSQAKTRQKKLDQRIEIELNAEERAVQAHS